jgi:hydrogenase maturation factor
MRLHAPTGVQIDIDESAVSVREDVQGTCEILGLDPLCFRVPAE